jgi:ABC-type Fe3+/spermidine/putrescine transport system ATPase subunit
VFDNVAFGLRMKHMAGQAVQDRVREVLALVGLREFEERSVNELSGGEAQRVALARSLASQPRLLMLDEPLGSLDRALRERLMVESRDILTGVGVTALYVTHDQAEAFAIANRTVVMHEGHIEQIGPPETIYRCPATPFVAHFLGLNNLSQGQIISPGQVNCAWGEIRVDTGRRQTGDRVSVLIRPEAAKLAADTTSPGEENILRGRLVARSFRGGRYRVQIQPEKGPPMTFELTAISQTPPEVGEHVTFLLDPAGLALLPISE